MTGAFKNFLNDNLIKICINNNFQDLNCILGTTEIVVSIIFIIIIFFGLIRLLNYYGKMNFETSLLLFSIMQIILLDIIIIIPHDVLFECFFFIQLCHISLTIRQFIVLIKNDKSNTFEENLFFTILNFINIIIFTLYILSLLDILLNNIYLYIQSFIRIYYFITAIILTYLCRKLIKKLKTYEKRNESYELTLKKSKYSAEESHNSNLFVSFYNNEWLFFLIRERQIIPLYILNLICSFIQMSFILSKHFILDDYFEKEQEYQYKIKSLKNEGIIIYYFYLIFCLLNVSVNYFCFYWIVRDQYKDHNDEIKHLKKDKKRKVLDENFIERETVQNKEDEKEISILMEEKIKDKKKFAKSIYLNSFTEVNEDNEKDIQENYFVPEKGEENDKKLEMTEHSYLDASGRGTMNSNNPINQSTSNNNTLLDNFEKIEN